VVNEDVSPEELTTMMEDSYGELPPTLYDLDAVMAWCANPGRAGLDPFALLHAWSLLGTANAAPYPAPFDPMGMYGLHENMRSDPANREWYETILLGMKLSGIVRDAERRGGGDAAGAEWPPGEEFWTADDFPKLAVLLKNGVTVLAARLSPEAAETDVRVGWPAPSPRT
jgi:hypothetical protein